MGILAIVSPPSAMFGSMTSHLRIGWSWITTSLFDWKETWIVTGRSVGDRVAWSGVTEKSLHSSRGHSKVGSNLKLQMTYTNTHTVSYYECSSEDNHLSSDNIEHHQYYNINLWLNQINELSTGQSETFNTVLVLIFWIYKKIIILYVVLSLTISFKIWNILT